MSETAAKEAEPVVAQEVAEEDFLRMCRAFRVDTNVQAMDRLSALQFAERRETVVSCIMRGTLTVSPSDGLPTFMPEGSKALTFKKPTGATFMIAEQAAPGTQPITRMAAAISEMTGINRPEISRLLGPDFTVAQQLASLFLAQ
jgi:hypothetical protein